MQKNKCDTLTRLLFAQGGLCFFCNGPLGPNDASVEHLVAKANGGSNGDGNLVACCIALNNLLGSRSLKEKIQVCLNQKGQFACPNGVQRKVAKAGPPASEKRTKLLAECYAKLVANLKLPKRTKPGTVKKLRNTIDALFQKKLSSSEVDALVQQLKSRKVIFITGPNVTYAEVSNKTTCNAELSGSQTSIH
mgnify:CR=1 FL=1